MCWQRRGTEKETLSPSESTGIQDDVPDGHGEAPPPRGESSGSTAAAAREDAEAIDSNEEECPDYLDSDGDEIDAEFARRVREHMRHRTQAAGKGEHSQTERGNQLLKTLCERRGGWASVSGLDSFNRDGISKADASIFVDWFDRDGISKADASIFVDSFDRHGISKAHASIFADKPDRCNNTFGSEIGTTGGSDSDTTGIGATGSDIFTTGSEIGTTGSGIDTTGTSTGSDFGTIGDNSNMDMDQFEELEVEEAPAPAAAAAAQQAQLPFALHQFEELEVEEAPPAAEAAPRRKPSRSAEGVGHAKEVKLKKAVKELKQKLKAIIRNVAAMVPGSELITGRPGTALGRKRKIEAGDFQLATRAVFLKFKRNINIGVKHERIQTVACAVARLRQEKALKHCFEKSADMWDEVEVKQAWRPSKKYRALRKNVAQPTLVQRTTVNLSLVNLSRKEGGQFQTIGYLQPTEVGGTKAMHLLPGILKGMPEQWDFQKVAKLIETLGAASSLTFMPMCDKASSNVSIMKMWAGAEQQFKEALPELGKKLLYFPDTRGIHSHHRGKLALKGLRPHTMRHYSIASMSRYRGNLSRCIHGIENIVQSQLHREVGPAPPVPDTLERVADFLYDFSAGHHRRPGKGGKGDGESQLLKDLKGLTAMANGSLTAEKWTHWCWGASLQRPCCRSLQDSVEKTTVAAVHALYGSADPRPAEIRWTHSLPSFKRTLVRRILRRVGLDCFVDTTKEGELDGLGGQQFGVDQEGTDAFFKHIIRVRTKKVRDYYADDRNMYKLVVFTAVLEASDGNLLYPLLGDAIKDKAEEKSKLDTLLGEDSVIGRCSQDVLGLLDSWSTGDRTRRPWMLLDILGAPLTDQVFSRWARGQIVKLTTVMRRRYESRFSAWPYRFYPLSHGRSTEADKKRVAREALDAPDHMIDCYTRGIRNLFPSDAALLSTHCRTVLAADFRAHCYGTGMIERLNALYTVRHPVRAPGRNAVNAEREHFLDQVKAIHQKQGGDDPLAVRKLGNSSSVEAVTYIPLLDGASFGSVPVLPALGDAPAPMAIEDAPANADEQAIAPAAPAAEHRNFEEPIVARIPNPNLLPGDRAASEEADGDGTKRWLRRYMLAKNRHLEDARKSKGSRMIWGECVAHGEEFRELYADADPDVYNEAYADWRHSGGQHQHEQVQQPYELWWGGGSRASPFTPGELCQYIVQHGWPKDSAVFDVDLVERRATPDFKTKFTDTDEIDPWGMSRSARNADRPGSRVPAAWDVVEKGIYKFLLSINAGKGEDDASGVMLIIAGRTVHGDGHMRFASLVTDVTFNPCVFDVTLNEFEKHAHEELALPSWVNIAERQSRVSVRHRAIDTNTSDQWINLLIDKLQHMDMYIAGYEICHGTGTLRRSKIIGLKLIGRLWDPSMQKPLAFYRRGGGDPKMREGDPFGEEAQPEPFVREDPPDLHDERALDMADSDCQSEIEEVEELEAVHMEGKLPDYMAEWQHPPVVPGPLHVDGRPPADDFLDEEEGAAMAEAAFSFLEEDIVKWLFEVEPTPDGAHVSVNKPLAKQHMDPGRAKWSAKAHKAKAKAKAAA
ncbi:unnamed protein product [Prorocentrum cordatum]|uniref:RNA-directed RNA polymerase n=1 Tax=Prorocentrum cordatum TaxID=2364126 RepID=A0ABN9VY18_9DINO|nr:unnamed protein product [Polarella glacialis]